MKEITSSLVLKQVFQAFIKVGYTTRQLIQLFHAEHTDLLYVLEKNLSFFKFLYTCSIYGK
jgi:hypothetical protein